MSNEVTSALERELSGLRQEIGVLERQVEILDGTLAPVRAARLRIEGQIRATHHPKRFDPNRAMERVPLFFRLLEISVKHGKQFNERKVLAQRSKAYQREAEKIQRELQRGKKNQVRNTG